MAIYLDSATVDSWQQKPVDASATDDSKKSTVSLFEITFLCVYFAFLFYFFLNDCVCRDSRTNVIIVFFYCVSAAVVVVTTTTTVTTTPLGWCLNEIVSLFFLCIYICFEVNPINLSLIVLCACVHVCVYAHSYQLTHSHNIWNKSGNFKVNRRCTFVSRSTCVFAALLINTHTHPCHITHVSCKIPYLIGIGRIR